MAVITLTTDWGMDGAYTGAFRGLLYSMLPQVPVIDICNSIKPYDIGQASFVLSQSFQYFPAGSIHIVGVCPVTADKTMLRYLAISCAGHYFIGANSGIWRLLMGESEFDLHEIAIQPKQYGNTGFPELEIFARAAAGVIKRSAIDFLGKPLPPSALVQQMPLLPRLTANQILGHIVFFDAYGNAITDITQQDMEDVGKGRPFQMFVASAANKITFISDGYGQHKAGQLLALYSFSGFVEVAIANANLKSVLCLSLVSEIHIKFHDAPAQKSLF